MIRRQQRTPRGALQLPAAASAGLLPADVSPGHWNWMASTRSEALWTTTGAPCPPGLDGNDAGAIVPHHELALATAVHWRRNSEHISEKS